MKQLRQVTAIIEREGDGYVALCPELDVASQGGTIESARNNLQEAVELFLETASPSEIKRPLHRVPLCRFTGIDAGWVRSVLRDHRPR